MTKKPKNVIAVTPNGDITLDMLLGFYALFSVPETPVSAAKLRRVWIAEIGDPAGLIPKVPKAVHAFQRACRSVETRRPADEADSSVTEIKVNKVLESADECVYQVNRLTRDREEKVIEHPKSLRLTFDPKDQGIVSEWFDEDEHDRLLGLDEDIREHFEANSAKISAAKVRSAVRKTLEELGATKVVRNGVYFVPRTGHKTLEALQTVFREIYGDDSTAELHLIPAADTGAEKDIIAKHFTASASKQADKLIATVSHYLKDRDGDVRAHRLRNLIAERRKLASAAEKYCDILDEELELVREKLEIVDDQIETLTVKSGKRADI